MEEFKATGARARSASRTSRSTTSSGSPPSATSSRPSTRSSSTRTSSTTRSTSTARQHGIATEAWSPIAQGAVLDEPVITEIADRLGRTPAQVVLRWHLQRGNIVFPKSTTPARIRGELRAVRLRARGRRPRGDRCPRPGRGRPDRRAPGRLRLRARLNRCATHCSSPRRARGFRARAPRLPRRPRRRAGEGSPREPDAPARPRRRRSAVLASGRMRPIPLGAIVGTVDPTTDFDAGFRPAADRVSSRWQSIARAHRDGRALPPIVVLERPDGYYVLDGRHRVSVARALGHETIDAWASASPSPARTAPTNQGDTHAAPDPRRPQQPDARTAPRRVSALPRRRARPALPLEHPHCNSPALHTAKG